MTFNIIDKPTWNRDESYSHYFNDEPCTYSMTVNLDITNLMKSIKGNELKFFPTILHGLSCIVNLHKEFRMDIDAENNIGYYSTSNPCYTVFHNESETITNVWTEYDNDFDMFIKNYTDDMLKYKNDYKNSKPLNSKNIFNVSCIPWTSFTGFNLNLQKGFDYLPPIFTIGKYFSTDEKTLLPLAIQVHHAVCDGFHISHFVNDMQNWADNFKR